jgi:purine-binding chemotaxis protein CheW
MTRKKQSEKPRVRRTARVRKAKQPPSLDPSPLPEATAIETVSEPPVPTFAIEALAGPPRRPLREAIAARDGLSDTLVFRVGAERFAIDLAAVEEAIELPSVHHLPEMPDHLLGVFELRARLVPIYSPERVLRVALGSDAAAVLVLRANDRRLGLAVDDVDDVLTIDGAAVRRAPIPDNDDNVLLGVIRRGADLLALIDAESLALACLADQLTEAV